MPTFLAFVLIAVAFYLGATIAVFRFYRAGSLSARTAGAMMGVRWGIAVLLLAVAIGATSVVFLVLLPVIAVVILIYGRLGINNLPEFRKRR